MPWNRLYGHWIGPIGFSWFGDLIHVWFGDLLDKSWRPFMLLVWKRNVWPWLWWIDNLPTQQLKKVIFQQITGTTTFFFQGPPSQVRALLLWFQFYCTCSFTTMLNGICPQQCHLADLAMTSTYSPCRKHELRCRPIRSSRKEPWRYLAPPNFLGWSDLQFALLRRRVLLEKHQVTYLPCKHPLVISITSSATSSIIDSSQFSANMLS